MATQEADCVMSDKSQRCSKDELLAYSADIERELARFPGPTLEDGKPMPRPSPWELPERVRADVESLREIVDQALEGEQPSGDEVTVPLKLTTGLLTRLHNIPVVTNPCVELYEDEGGRSPRQDFHGVMLETTSGAGRRQYQVLPTTCSFGKGDVLIPRYNNGNMCGASWFKRPETGTIELAFPGSAEFTGHPPGRPDL